MDYNVHIIEYLLLVLADFNIVVQCQTKYIVEILDIELLSTQQTMYPSFFFILKRRNFQCNRCSIIFIWFVTFCYIKEHDNLLVRSSKYKVLLASWNELQVFHTFKSLQRDSNILDMHWILLLYGLVVVTIIN